MVDFEIVLIVDVCCEMFIFLIVFCVISDGFDDEYLFELWLFSEIKFIVGKFGVVMGVLL